MTFEAPEEIDFGPQVGLIRVRPHPPTTPARVTPSWRGAGPAPSQAERIRALVAQGLTVKRGANGSTVFNFGGLALPRCSAVDEKFGEISTIYKGKG